MKIKKLVIREHIEVADLVSKKAQKWILGGYGGMSGTCAAISPGVGNACCVSREIAEEFANSYGGRWCCDSCSSATWYADLNCNC